MENIMKLKHLFIVLIAVGMLSLNSVTAQTVPLPWRMLSADAARNLDFTKIVAKRKV